MVKAPLGFAHGRVSSSASLLTISRNAVGDRDEVPAVAPQPSNGKVMRNDGRMSTPVVIVELVVVPLI